MKHQKNTETHKEKKVQKKKNKKQSHPTESGAKNSNQKNRKPNNKYLRITKNLDDIPNYEDESNQNIFGEKLDIKDELVGTQTIWNSRSKREVESLGNETPNFLLRKDKRRENMNLEKNIKYKSRRMQSIDENNFQYKTKIVDGSLIDSSKSNNLQNVKRKNKVYEFENNKFFETTTKIPFYLLNITCCATNEVSENSFLELHTNSEDTELKIPKVFFISEENLNKVDNQSIEKNEKPQDFEKRLIGRQLCNHKSPNKNKKSTHKIKNQNSRKVKMKKNEKKNHTKNNKGSKKVKHISKKKTKSKSGNNTKNTKSISKSEEHENVNSEKGKYQSQTVVPVENGKIRVKYIFRDDMSNFEENREIRKVDFQADKKHEENYEKKRQENCKNCICDLSQAVVDLRHMLGKRNDLLGKIKTYQCNLYTDIGNEIQIISGPIDLSGQLRRDFEETRGLKYVESGKMEDVLKRGIVDVNGIFL